VFSHIQIPGLGNWGKKIYARKKKKTMSHQSCPVSSSLQSLFNLFDRLRNFPQGGYWRKWDICLYKFHNLHETGQKKKRGRENGKGSYVSDTENRKKGELGREISAMSPRGSTKLNPEWG